MLVAVAACADMLGRGLAPRFAVASAAHMHAVDADELAMRILERTIAAQRARAALAGMKACDDELGDDATKSPGQRPRVYRPRKARAAA